MSRKTSPATVISSGDKTPNPPCRSNEEQMDKNRRRCEAPVVQPVPTSQRTDPDTLVQGFDEDQMKLYRAMGEDDPLVVVCIAPGIFPTLIASGAVVLNAGAGPGQFVWSMPMTGQTIVTDILTYLSNVHGGAIGRVGNVIGPCSTAQSMLVLGKAIALAGIEPAGIAAWNAINPAGGGGPIRPFGELFEIHSVGVRPAQVVFPPYFQ